MKNVLLFDLGNTLAQYYDVHDFPAILKQAIIEVEGYLSQNGLLHVSEDNLWCKVKEEDHESIDYRVRPLEERLARIFELDNLPNDSRVADAMCRCFMKPIFARGYCYEDSLPALRELREKGCRTAIISNTSWGSPAYLWREELNRLGLSTYMNTVVFCRDVGWRKPARQIFLYALEKLSALPQDCVFVGDEPKWDVVGPRAVGITPILIDRSEASQSSAEPKPIRSLNELLPSLTLLK
jgi:putative hydrolase of the HAD superfamily